MTELHQEIERLTAEVKRLNGHRFVRVQNSLWRLIALQFARGLAFGLGSVVGATLLVSALAYSLRHIDFVPIIGDWAAKIATEINNNK